MGGVLSSLSKWFKGGESVPRPREFSKNAFPAMLVVQRSAKPQDRASIEAACKEFKSRYSSGVAEPEIIQDEANCVVRVLVVCETQDDLASYRTELTRVLKEHGIG